MYQITEYSFQKAKQIGLEIFPSKRKNKKIDIYKNGKYLASIGDTRYMDYPTFLARDGKEIADKHRKLYRIRHKNDNGIAGKLAMYILW